MFGVHSAAADTIHLEAENFVASGNAGGARITASTCADASAGFAVNGMDAEGDWIELEFAVDDAFCFVDSLRSAGDVGMVRTFAVEFSGGNPTIALFGDTLRTPPGRGFA